MIWDKDKAESFRADLDKILENVNTKLDIDIFSCSLIKAAEKIILLLKGN
jgi:hypothetical protein